VVVPTGSETEEQAEFSIDDRTSARTFADRKSEGIIPARAASWENSAVARHSGHSGDVTGRKSGRKETKRGGAVSGASLSEILSQLLKYKKRKSGPKKRVGKPGKSSEAAIQEQELKGWD